MAVRVDQSHKLRQSVAYPRRITTAIQNSVNPDKVAFNPIIDCEGKPSGQKPMVFEMQGMNACVESK